ncbi:bifunctional riboflavin kinase/FAD synthetase [Neolewinella lacunae]|uniref:Bifunctional riboflavin kinase/FMN adenylyltransferase n=1 Tax=Neolewinella lacunae TaxID=1517758 RepID=A0A923PMV7_9BACT|nr:bifunctional riboflavin kinase/FAD synthetase [Neolewinella lacunae]MBC6995330.1 bifunctional riboflavin kinase/FAD synthetase [Neolewinella lacunae]MDN3633042.1 bifunctional riboflavin kinase/FAD synthetase [Neolewinella lacunae]
MKIHYELAELPRFRRAVVTIGSFDGVHRGHQQLLARIRRLAERRGGESIVITFDPHPRAVLQPEDNSLRLLTTTVEKARYCAEAGIDHLVVIPFTAAFSQLTPEEYIENFLVRYFQPDRIVIGYDHRFGKDRKGDLAYLRHHGRGHKYEVIEIDAQEVNDITVSSTKIRQALLAGEIGTATSLLGHPYLLTGTVVSGAKIGRTIGFPTANLVPSHDQKLIPADGIYAVRVGWDGRELEGMLYIGQRPVLQDGRGRTIELNIFDFAEELYGEILTVSFHERLRGDITLEGLEALREQLEKDEVAARQSLARLEEKTSTVPGHTPATAVVILNYNGRAYLEKYLPEVLANLPDYARAVVADNCSTDDSVVWLREQHPDLELIELPENYGFANGYNEALRRVKAEVYVLLNSDVRVTPGWIERIIPLFERPDVAAIQPKILAEGDHDVFEYAGAAGGYLDYLGYPFCRGRLFHHTERDEGQYDGQKEIFWASGAAFFCRAELFHALGGFEPEYFAHAEEIDLCWRMKRAGYRILVEPRSVVYHVGGGTLSYNTPRKTYLNFRNTLSTSFKNEPLGRLLWWLPVRLLLDGLAAVLFLSQGNVAHIGSILRAHGHFYGHFSMWIKRRRQRSAEIEAVSIGLDRTEIGRIADSIILHYYLLGHRRFAEVVTKQVRSSRVE